MKAFQRLLCLFFVLTLTVAGCGKTEIPKKTEPTAGSQPMKNGKKEITMGVLTLTMEMREQVSQYNQESDEYVITVIEYSEEAKGDYAVAEELITNAFHTGNVPDLIQISASALPRQVWNQWTLDLYPFLDADPDYGRESFVPNILSAMEVDGRLPFLCANVTITTLVGKESSLGSSPGWSMEELQRTVAEMPGSMQLFGDITPLRLLSDCMNVNIGDYVNRQTGQCSFDTAEFAALLEWCGSLPQRPPYYDENFPSPDTMASVFEEQYQLFTENLRDDRFLLVSCVLHSRAVRQYRALFEGEVNFIGYPSVNGYGAAFNAAGDSLSISATTPYPEEAWSILRQLMDPERRLDPALIPTTQARLDKSIELEMTPIDERLDEDGKPLDSLQHYEIRTLGFWIYGSGTVLKKGQKDFEQFPLTRAEADQLLEIIYSVTRWGGTESQIIAVIEETADAYFSGQGTAKEAAEIIQKRVSILLSEQS